MCHSRAWAEEARNSRNFRSNYLGEARGRAGQETGEGGATELRLDHFLLHLALILPGLHKKATQVESVLALGQGILN